jgi:hypothetical protein
MVTTKHLVFCSSHPHTNLNRGLRVKAKIYLVGGRAIAQAVSRRLPTAAARVQTRV